MDIRAMESHPDCYCLWIYQSTKSGGSTLQAGGKTSNAPRILPLPDKLYRLLSLRHQRLEEMIMEGDVVLNGEEGQSSVDDLPIVCLNQEYTVRCSANHLTQAGQKLLEEIRLNENELSYIDRDLHNENLAKEMGVAEKDPTTYLLRRNLGTHLYLLGLTESEIQYVMGHNIEGNEFVRSDFTNEMLLYQIKQKMDNRPLLNDTFAYQIPTVVEGDTEQVDFDDIPQKVIQLSAKGKVFVRLQSLEPQEKITIRIAGSDLKQMRGWLRVFKGKDTVTYTTNILRKYHDIYQKAVEKHVKAGLASAPRADINGDVAE